ncbi:MAG: ABC transporter ATP-binding protein [Deltaproteobacteria bacterium]|jgi:ABC-2 type transport system ATP-binding protein|nr:ABC transporter ATP-binding protein [Deltaproteobacteria bacterium]
MDKCPVVELSGVDAGYGRGRALAGVSLTVKKGARLALLGPNGAGKSTLMKVICGALGPVAGRVTLGGMGPGEAILDPGFLGWLPEGAPLMGELTVGEHLGLAGKLRGLGRAGTRAEIDRLAGALGLGPKLGRLASTLSMGSRRMAALAVAFLGEPRLLVLDEPTASLDPDGIGRFEALIGALPAGKTLIVSSHMLPGVAMVTDSAVFLREGRVVGEGPWEALAGGRRDPALSYRAAIGHGQDG